MSIGNLLSATNAQRQQNGVANLKLNDKLTSAAQAKANDMIARNYWSHNTPDGQEPWVFFTNAGYNYQKAGENLAYGFATSGDTVTGWMNSPPHRENLLDSTFTEVGFGFANGNNFNSSGQETVVVAEYGEPQVLAASNNQTPAPAPAPKPAPTPAQSTPAPQATPVNQPTSVTTTTPASEATPEKPAPSTQKTDTVVAEPPTKPITRLENLTGGKAPWALVGLGTIMGAALVLLLIKHAVGLKRALLNSERFILHHPLLDTVLVSLVLFGSFMLQTTGFIR
jgi:hypothetical protein